VLLQRVRERLGAGFLDVDVLGRVPAGVVDVDPGATDVAIRAVVFTQVAADLVRAGADVHPGEATGTHHLAVLLEVLVRRLLGSFERFLDSGCDVHLVSPVCCSSCSIGGLLLPVYLYLAAFTTLGFCAAARNAAWQLLAPRITSALMLSQGILLKTMTPSRRTVKPQAL
jgi:hypothetical protein